MGKYGMMLFIFETGYIGLKIALLRSLWNSWLLAFGCWLLAVGF